MTAPLPRPADDERADTRSDVADDDSQRGDDDGGDPDGEQAAVAPAPLPVVDGALTCPAPTVEVTDADGSAPPSTPPRPATSSGWRRARTRASSSPRPTAGAEPIWLCGPRRRARRRRHQGRVRAAPRRRRELAARRVHGAQRPEGRDGRRRRRHVHPGPARRGHRRRGDPPARRSAPTTSCAATRSATPGQRRDEVRRGRLRRQRREQLVHAHRLRARPQRPQRRRAATTSRDHGRGVDVKEGTTGGVVARQHVRRRGADRRPTRGSTPRATTGCSRATPGRLAAGRLPDARDPRRVGHGQRVHAATSADVDGPGYGFATTNTDGQRRRCDNEVSGAGEGFADVECVE